MAVAWPAVRAALASALPDAVDEAVSVYDGPVISGDAPSAYLTVGDQPSSDDASAGSFEQDVGPDGFSAVETGVVLCELGAVTGDTSVPSVFATFDLIASHLQSNQRLDGALSPGSTVTCAADVLQEQSQSGARQRLLISVSYFTRLP